MVFMTTLMLPALFMQEINAAQSAPLPTLHCVSAQLHWPDRRRKSIWRCDPRHTRKHLWHDRSSRLGNGTVFRLDPTGSQTVLHSFAAGTDGSAPIGDLILDGDGKLYGTTYYGGTPDNGTVFTLDSTAGDETVLYTFTGGADGKWPLGVVRDAKGNLYGGAQIGGTYFARVIYKTDD